MVWALGWKKYIELRFKYFAIDPKALAGPFAQGWLQTFPFPKHSQKQQTNAKQGLVASLAEQSTAPLPPSSLELWPKELQAKSLLSHLKLPSTFKGCWQMVRPYVHAAPTPVNVLLPSWSCWESGTQQVPWHWSGRMAVAEPDLRPDFLSVWVLPTGQPHLENRQSKTKQTSMLRHILKLPQYAWQRPQSSRTLLHLSGCL